MVFINNEEKEKAIQDLSDNIHENYLKKVWDNADYLIAHPPFHFRRLAWASGECASYP